MERHRRHVITKLWETYSIRRACFPCFEMGNQKGSMNQKCYEMIRFVYKLRIILMCHNFVLTTGNLHRMEKPPTIEVPYARVYQGNIWQPKGIVKSQVFCCSLLVFQEIFQKRLGEIWRKESESVSMFVQNCRLVKHFNLWASFLFILACDYKKMWVVTQQTIIKTCETKIQPPKVIDGPLKWRHFWGAFGFLRRKKEGFLDVFLICTFTSQLKTNNWNWRQQKKTLSFGERIQCSFSNRIFFPACENFHLGSLVMSLFSRRYGRWSIRS